MSDSAIRFKNVTKKFKLNSEKPVSLVDRIFSVIGINRGNHEDLERFFYAIKDISFDIRKGETVGFVGTNGEW